MGKCPNHKNSHGKHYSHKSARRTKFEKKDILAVSFSCMCLDCWRELGFQGSLSCCSCVETWQGIRVRCLLLALVNPCLAQLVFMFRLPDDG